VAALNRLKLSHLGRVYATLDKARRDLFGYIEGFYKPRRLQSALGCISPVEAERRAA
jgi:putative transposase